MRIALGVLSAVLVAGLSSSSSLAQVYDPPDGGWTYIYTGDQGVDGGRDNPFTSLDGTWDYANGSDSWDGSIIGQGKPGGVTGGLVDGDTVYTRFQEIGDGRDHGFGPDPSNRKLYFGHNITEEGATETIIDDGVTLSFRARVSTGGILDDVHPDGGGAITPWPEGGVGYNLHNGSKSIFTIKQQAGGSVSFALALPSSEGSLSDGLVTNNLNGDAVSGTVDGFDDAGEINFLAMSDATDWHEFWVTIQAGGTGTHQVQIWRDGTAVPAQFDVTSGNGSDYGDFSYLALGLGATPRAGAVDVDFFSWAPGVVLPVDMIPVEGDFNIDGNVDEMDYFLLNDNLGLHVEQDVFFEDGDINVDGDVDLDDFARFKEIAPGAVAAALGIPEPSSVAIVLILLVGFAAFRQRKRTRCLRFLLAIALAVTLSNQASAQIDVFWDGSEDNDYNTRGNWDSGFVPDGTFDPPESGIIDNGGLAQLDSLVAATPQQLRLGDAADGVGTLEILDGGTIEVLEDFHVGFDGEGHLVMAPGSALTVADDMRNRGAAASSVVWGGAGGGNVLVQVTDDLEMRRNFRIIGPDVDATVGSLILGDEGTYTAEITGPAHSTIVATAGAALGGTLNLEFNGHTPTSDDSWTLVDAPGITGSFSSITSDATLDPGFGFFVTTQAGGAQGALATLQLGSRLELRVDPDSGAAEIKNLTESLTFDIDGYLITSSTSPGTITPGGWTSIADGDAAWREGGMTSARLAETSLGGSMSIGPDEAISLGSIITPPGAGGSLDDLQFTYHEVGGSTQLGLLAIGAVDGGGGDDIPGDYDGDDFVGQGDIDLVLLNWGSDVSGGPPNGWTTNLPSGSVDQDELDQVLLNWGNSAALGGATSVPEPVSCVIAVVMCLVALLARRLR